MAKEYKINIPAHPNIYKFNHREISVVFCEPEHGINGETGVALLITGFGEDLNSPKIVEARRNIADNNNLITVQCDYFGQTFMRGVTSPKYNFDLEIMKKIFTESEMNELVVDKHIDLEKLFKIGSGYSIKITGIEQLNESMDHFADFGLMQAIDNLSAILTVIAIIHENKYEINLSRIIAYGQSHGAYLAYLCNAFAPTLFTQVIDFGGVLFPMYLKSSRRVFSRVGKLSNEVLFNYLVHKIDVDEELLLLPNLYKKFKNQAHILSFYNATDTMTEVGKKRAFCQSTKSCMSHEVTVEEIDGEVFIGYPDGLINVNFEKFFNYVMNNLKVGSAKINTLSLPNTVIETAKNKYVFDYSNGVPVLELKNPIKGI